jgi:hypothetical protein
LVFFGESSTTDGGFMALFDSVAVTWNEELFLGTWNEELLNESAQHDREEELTDIAALRLAPTAAATAASKAKEEPTLLREVSLMTTGFSSSFPSSLSVMALDEVSDLRRLAPLSGVDMPPPLIASTLGL